MLDLVFQNLTADKQFKDNFFKKILEKAVDVLSSELKPKSYHLKAMSISVNLVGESKIKELNAKYRSKNKATDVLSFPMFVNSNLETRNKKQVKSKKLVSGRLSPVADLGDIFICLSIAKKEAKRENVSIDRKLAQLTVHGFLHLLGYDHERSYEEAKKMFGLENRILRSFLKISKS